MKDTQKKNTLVSVFSSVLILTFYERVSREAYLALALSSVLLALLTGTLYFLRTWLAEAWVRAAGVILAVLAAQTVWVKQGLEPWWALAAISLFWPAAAEPAERENVLGFAVRSFILVTAALCFFALRSALELTPSEFFWQHPAGHLGLLGLLATAVGLVEVRKGDGRGA